MSATRAVVTVLVGAAFAVLAFLAWTSGVDAWDRRTAPGWEVDAAELAVPSQVYDPPLVLDDTAHNGPPGPVALVFRGQRYRHGLTGTVTAPWIAVSAATGEYRVVAASHVPAAGEGEVTVAPDGSALAWPWEGGVVVYDTSSGEAHELAGDVATPPRHLVWSPDGRWLAFSADGVRVLDTGSGRVTAVPDLPEPLARRLTFSTDGRSLVAASTDAVTVLDWRTSGRQRFPALLGRVVDVRGGAGDKVATLSAGRFANPVRVVDPRPRGVRVARVAGRDLSVRGLVGWVGTDAVAVIGLRLETGPLMAVYGMPVDGGAHDRLVLLPASGGTNWTSPATLSVASGLLDRVRDVEEPQWPWDPRAKLSAVTLATMFVLGSLLLRPPRQRGRRRTH